MNLGHSHAKYSPEESCLKNEAKIFRGCAMVKRYNDYFSCSISTEINATDILIRAVENALVHIQQLTWILIDLQRGRVAGTLMMLMTYANCIFVMT